MNKLVRKYPDIVSSSENSSEIEVVKSHTEARITGTVEPKTNAIISIPSKFTGEVYPPLYPANNIMSGTPRDCKLVKMQVCLPELFNLKLVEANYKAEKTIRSYSQHASTEGLKFCGKSESHGRLPGAVR